MKRVIPFSKIEFQEYEGNRHSIILLNLNEKELSYQVLQQKFSNGEVVDETTLFTRGIKLSQEQMNSILPMCNALDYEPYRGKEMSMDDDGYIGYRDEVRLSFCAVTNDYLPLIRLPMKYYYDEEHIWPHEKLYRHLVTKYLMPDKKTRKWVTSYGCLSPF